MTADFVTILDGPLEYSDEVWAVLKETEEVKEEIKKIGEKRARRAGTILDVAVDGYYNAAKCREDFMKERSGKIPKKGGGRKGRN